MSGNDKRINSSLLFIAGIILVIVAGLVFVTTNWNILTGLHKVCLICFMTAIFFGSSAFACKLKLANTGNALYTLGCFFSAFTAVSLGWFRLLGGWFSFTGEGKMFFFAFCTLTLLIPSLTGVFKFNRKHYAFIMWSSLTAFVAFIAFGIKNLFDLNSYVISLILSTFSLTTVLTQRKMLDISNKTLRETYHIFAMLNTIVVSSIILLNKNNFFSMSILTVSWLKISLGKSEDNASGILSGLFMYMAIAAITEPDCTTDFFITFTAFSLTAVIFAKALPLSETLSKIFNIISTVASVIAINLCLVSLAFDWNTYSLIGIAILLAENVILIYKGDISAKYILPFTFFCLVLGMAQTADFNSYTAYFTMLTGTLAGFLCTLKFKALRSELTDLTTGVLTACSLIYTGSTSLFICYLTIAIFLLKTVYLLWENKSKCRLVFAYIFPYLLIITVFANGFYKFNPIEAPFYAIFFSVAFFAMLISDKRFAHLELSLLIASLPISLVAAQIKEQLWYSLIFVALWALRAFKSRNSEEIFSTMVAVIEAYLFAIPFYKALDNPPMCFYLCAVPFITIALSLLPSSLQKRLALVGESSAYFSIFIMLILIGEARNSDLITAVIFSSLAYVWICYKGKNTLAFLPVIYIYCFIAQKTTLLDTTSMIIALYTSAISLSLLSGGFKKYQSIDYPAIGGIIPVLVLFDKCDGFYGLLLAAILLCLCAIRTRHITLRKILFTISAFFLGCALLAQELVKIPNIIETEYAIAIVMAFAISLKYIWGSNKTVSMIIYLTGVCSILLLFADAINGGNVADGIILGLIGLAIMLAGFMLKKKKWFVLGTVTLVFVSVYMTKDFWLSLGWWAYLMLAGIVLITVAGINEWKKRVK